jgi:hypothetical protein
LRDAGRGAAGALLASLSIKTHLAAESAFPGIETEHGKESPLKEAFSFLATETTRGAAALADHVETLLTTGIQGFYADLRRESMSHQ